MVYNISVNESQPTAWSHNNDTTEDILDWSAVLKVVKGWPLYRDASEWHKYRDRFSEEGTCIFISWSGGVNTDDLIEVSKEGRANGNSITHRECGSLVDFNSTRDRAVVKLKTTITQRFSQDGVTFDVDCDNRSIVFCQKEVSKITGQRGWKARYHKVILEKDGRIPGDDKTAPVFTEGETGMYREGCKYLDAAQARLGHNVLTDLPTRDNEGLTKIYQLMDTWLESGDREVLLGVKW